MLVTVVTPTYQNFDHINNTIKSVLKQTYAEIEYIITDDGSREFCKEKLEKCIDIYKQENLVSYKIIHHDENVGTVENVNRAYGLANGRIIIALASDDEFYSDDVLEKIVQCYQKRRFNALVTSRMICDENGKELYYLPHFLERKRLSELSQKKQYDLFVGKRLCDIASGSCLVIDSEYFNSIGGFDKRYRLYEDAPFFAQYLEKNKLDVNFDIISIKYQMGGISTNQSINPVLKKDMITYAKTTRIEKLKTVSVLSRRIALYDLYVIKNEELDKKKILGIVRYIDVILYKRIINFIRSLFCRYDEHLIKKKG